MSLPPGPFFILLDVISLKGDLVTANLLVYEKEAWDTELDLTGKKATWAYQCEFVDQSEDTEMPRFRPFRIWTMAKGHKDKNYLDARLLPRLLKKASFTIIPSDVSNDKLAGIRQMYKELQLEKIYRAPYCYSCRFNHGNYIHLPGQDQVPLDEKLGRVVCEGCGWSMLVGMIERKGVKVTAGLREILRKKFLELRDIEKIARNFDLSWNPAEDDDFSLYDVQDVSIDPQESIPVGKTSMHPALRGVLEKAGIKDLLPVQVKALKAGLLERKNLLVASSTSSGKTLVGEIAGVNDLLLNGKGTFLFVVPLVALANQKHDEFTGKYGILGINTILRVGMSRIEKKSVTEKKRDLMAPGGKNIIVGTYEGVDYILRSGKKGNLSRIRTIVIDEIQMFKDEDRGARLDGFIARLKYTNPEAQIIYLSATVAAPKKLAKQLGATLVDYMTRPVPLERHLIPVLNESEKLRLLEYLVRKEFKKVSSHGFKGQTIVFTNSRRSVHDIANYLAQGHLRVEGYHSGLRYWERVRVEKKFEKQEIAAVITTAALGAGVDLPASQVIFHSLVMGIEWLTVAEFSQMLGRAGRFMKHDLGKVYLLVEPGKSYSGSQAMTEDKIALQLLSGEMQETMPPHDFEKIAGELLAFIAMEDSTSLEEIKRYHGLMLVQGASIVKLLNYLHTAKLVSIKDKGRTITILPDGKAICESFLEVEEGKMLRKAVVKYKQSVIDMVSGLKPLKNVYVTNAIIAELVKHKHGRQMISTRFFGGPVLDFLSMSSKDTPVYTKRKKLSRMALGVLTAWATDIFTCNCEERPYCDHGIKNLAKIILRLRRRQKMSPEKITQYLQRTYQILIYSGDVYDFLDAVLHGLEAIHRFAKIAGNEKMIEVIEQYKEKIESP